MKQTLTIRIGPEQMETLKEIAKTEERSLSAIIRRFIDEGIKNRINTKGIKKGIIL